MSERGERGDGEICRPAGHIYMVIEGLKAWGKTGVNIDENWVDVLLRRVDRDCGRLLRQAENRRLVQVIIVSASILVFATDECKRICACSHL